MSNENERAALIEEFYRLGGHQGGIDRRWSNKRLLEAIESMRERVAKAQAEQAKWDAIVARRTATAATRGSFEAFANTALTKNYEGRSEEEDRLAWISRGHNAVITDEEKTTLEFTQRLHQDPAYALGWSANYFRYAAKLAVAKRFRSVVEEGHSVDEIRQMLYTQVMEKSASMSRSTSMQSNIMEDDYRVALTEALRDMKWE